MKTKYQINDIVRSLLPIHENRLQFWRVKEIEVGERTGKIRYVCESTSSELKARHGVDAMSREFNENELELS